MIAYKKLSRCWYQFYLVPVALLEKINIVPGTSYIDIDLEYAFIFLFLITNKNK